MSVIRNEMFLPLTAGLKKVTSREHSMFSGVDAEIKNYGYKLCSKL